MQRFGAKLDLAMKVANLSRGRLAASVGVDKSVVSRWVNDQARPSEHNLTLLTNLLRQYCPDFSRLTWELDPAGFARAIGAPASDEAATATAPPASLQLATLAVSRAAVPREGLVYPGLYLGFRKAFANTGITIAKGLMIRLAGNRLEVRASDGTFNYAGEALLLRGQLFLIVEEANRLDEVLTFVLNGVAAPMACILDGLMSGVALDRTSTPSSTAIVFRRVGDLTGVADDDDVSWDELVAELRHINGGRDARARMPAEFARVVDNLVGSPRDSGEVDHVLRVPFARSLATTTSAANWGAAADPSAAGPTDPSAQRPQETISGSV